MMNMRGLLAMVLVLSFGAATAQAAAGDRVFDVPRIEGVSIDGKLKDWKSDGLQVNVLLPWQTKWPLAADLDARFALAWDQDGLLLAVQVQDDISDEAESTESIWQRDGLELFIADKVNGPMRAQILVAPGMSEKFPELRTHVFDRRPNDKRDIEARIDAARTKTDGGYIIEARLPWDMLGVEAKKQSEIGFQLFVNDTDGGKREKFVWFPAPETSSSWNNMHRVRLADKASAPVIATASAEYEYLKRLRVNMTGTSAVAGSTAVLRDGKQELARTTLTEWNGRAVGKLRVALPRKGSFKNLTVQVAGHEPIVLQPDDLAKARAERLFWSKLRVHGGHTFNGNTFPEFTFDEPGVMEGAIGPYEINVTFYNADHQPVDSAEQPGRYGAVIKITTDDGRTFTRYRTVFRTPEDWVFWRSNISGAPSLPDEFGIKPEIQQMYQDDITDTYKWGLVVNTDRYPWPAIMAAGLYELQEDTTKADGSVYTMPWTRDRQWWVEHKRMLNGNDKRFTKKLECPRPIEGEPARTVREGTLAEAGMVGDAPQRIDAVLSEWAANSDEAFIACVVRNGVIVLHKAYGTRDGDAMKTDTDSYMASLSKLISGACVMMVVDQGLLSLDEPIDTYSPELKGAKFNVMPTLRHLYSHTAGMTSHRGEDDHDLEHFVAEFAPYTKVAEKYQYNGLSLELGLKLLEQVTGECYPLFIKKRLLDPLGCENTEALNASWNTRSVALDMAKIGQMLLNGGAYGEHRFMSEKTRDAMLPRKLTQLGKEKAETGVYGVGTVWYNHDGLSERCFGHGAASSATLRIDLEHDLVISMTRNSAGKNFKKYGPKFIQTVVDCMKKE